MLPLKNITAYDVAKKKYNVFSFEPVKTTALKLEMQLSKDNSTGIHAWAVK